MQSLHITEALTACRQDRTMIQVLDGLRSVADKVDGLISRVSNLERMLPKHKPSGSCAVSPRAPHHETCNGEKGGLEIALPSDHSMAAHQLLEIWPSMQPFYTSTGVVDANYPMENEERRGLLRIYGRGQGAESENTPPVGSPEDSSHSDEYRTPSPQEGLWGTGLATALPPMKMRRSHPSTPGGSYHDVFTKGNPGRLNPDGSFELDVKTVRGLHNSYLRNMHILHPFLDRGHLEKMIKQFMLRYSPDVDPGHVSTSEHYSSIPLKRKHSKSSSEYPAAPDINGSSMKQLPERSIGNAIILLVLALGKVCEHKKVLPGPVGEIPSPLEHPSRFVKPSPGSSNAMLGGSPLFSDGIQRGRQHSTDAVFEGEDANLRNIDILPGLAYYAYATDILGNLHGGNEVAHAQAFLLAGLYMGQYARVLESWSWISLACRVCHILIKR